jgi:hypothetical protein
MQAYLLRQTLLGVTQRWTFAQQHQAGRTARINPG